MAARRDEIIDYCDELLAIADFDDLGPNGLQVPGSAEVTKVVSGVSAHLELLQRAREAKAELVIAHHGLFWEFLPRALSEQTASRLRTALEAEISVAAYHLPLDAHAEIGNNALLCEALGFARDTEPFGEYRGRALGAIGRRERPLPAAELFAAAAELLGREPLVIDGGPPEVRSLGVVTGAGSSVLAEAVARGLDAFITGEPAEHAMADAREGGIHFIAAGHYATETLGIRRLGELIAERFAVEHRFIDVPNPV